MLETPSGYRTHWTTPQEAEEVVKSLGMDVVRLLEKGTGVLVAARVNGSKDANWDEFDVEKWRDAMFSTRSFRVRRIV